MDLIARISELFDKRGWSKNQFAKEADLFQSTISSMMKYGNHSTVSAIERCCAAFGISVADYFCDDLQTTDFILEERKLSDWRSLSPEMKKAVIGMNAAAQAELKELSQTK